MTNHITYSEFIGTDFESLLVMSQKLWKEFEKRQLSTLLKESSLSNSHKILIAKDRTNEYIGFAIFSIRTDYVEGALTTPTGYLEGIYVAPNYRKLGIAKQFLHLGESWCATKGCTQIGSDTWISNKQSRDFHKHMGFWEEDELVHFLKKIDRNQ